jgi:glucoamylase
MVKRWKAAAWLAGFEFVFLGTMAWSAPLAEPADRRSWGYLLANVGPQPSLGLEPGVVIAGTSKSNPNYFYHWVRDAALVMEIVARVGKHSPTARKRSDELLHGFAAFSRKNQESFAYGGLGEPKYHVDGSAYLGPWGRPQNDGPALRASTLIRWAERLLDEGREAEVVPNLYDRHLPAASIIKRDLEYTAHHWREKNFDLWEEIEGTHFYTRLAQRRAMLDGARFAERLGDGGAAAFYREQAKAIDADLGRFWNASLGVLMPTVDRTGGIDYKHSHLDTSVILAILHAGEATGDWSPTDPRVQSTLAAIVDRFRSLYAINGNGKPGVALGRYPEDRYDGYSTGGEGNPWFLTTFAAAELQYRAAATERRRGNGARAAALRVEADQFFARALAHASRDGRMAEQLNRHSGFEQGAENLTWSYAAHVAAALARDGYN